MRNNSVVFIAFEENENLGIGYLAAVLSGAGFRTHLVDFRKDRDEIHKKLCKLDPMLVGFSVIFEYHIFEFRDLISYLRDQAIHCHFTAGGLFGSMRPDDLFQLIPALDSIVRFEGEYTMLELAGQLASGKDWKQITGISYREGDRVTHNPLRRLEPDLDMFPIPLRPAPKSYALDTTFSTLIAGRGCIHDCSFCNIREFYGEPPGPLKRVRNPVRAVEEMELLFLERGVRVFLFQDDDFPVKEHGSSGWIKTFCNTLDHKNLTGQILWKINCRPDEIEPESFELMKRHGLFRVFLGIEDGTDPGLRKINKKLRVEDQLNGIRVLKDLGIEIDYGFMLFQPDSTHETLNQNLDFLELICGDGYMPVAFTKMLPFMGTRIEGELKSQGRLKGAPGHFDYNFLDGSMDELYDFALQAFNSWLNDKNGFAGAAKWAANYLSVYSYFIGTHRGIRMLDRELRQKVASANKYLITTMKELSRIFQSGKHLHNARHELGQIKKNIENTHTVALKEIDGILAKIDMFHLTRGIFV